MREKGIARILFLFITLGLFGVLFFIIKDRNNSKLPKETPTDELLLEEDNEESKQLQEDRQSHTNVSSEWKTFNGSEFDINFEYPADWEVITGYAQDGVHDFECTYIAEFLKSPADCIGTHKSPMVVVKPISGQHISHVYEGLMLWGPTSGLGGGCPECTIKNEVVTIGGTKYTIPVKIAPKGSARSSYSTFPDGGVYIKVTGAKSTWSKIDLELDTSNEDTYDTIIKIVETIKPN